MAFDVTALTAYIEDQDFPLIAQVQATGGLAEAVNIQAGIKGSSNLQFLDSDVVFGADGCSRTPAGTTTFTQRTITVGAIAISEDLCVKDLIGYWTQTMMKQGANTEAEVPGEIERLWLDTKMNKLKNQLAISDFQGDTGSGTNNLSYYDGLLKLVDADGTVLDGNTGAITVAVGITTANVLAILDDMWTEIPDNISEESDLSLWMPTTVYKKYVIALKNANLFHFKGEDGIETLYGTNLRIRKSIGLPSVAGTERMLIARDSNITIGVDGTGDEDAVDVRVNPATNKSVFYDVTFKRGVQYAFGDEIVEFTLVP